jgi:hypothetical protein
VCVCVCMCVSLLVCKGFKVINYQHNDATFGLILPQCTKFRAHKHLRVVVFFFLFFLFVKGCHYNRNRGKILKTRQIVQRYCSNPKQCLNIYNKIVRWSWHVPSSFSLYHSMKEHKMNYGFLKAYQATEILSKMNERHCQGASSHGSVEQLEKTTFSRSLPTRATYNDVATVSDVCSDMTAYGFLDPINKKR